MGNIQYFPYVLLFSLRIDCVCIDIILDDDAGRRIKVNIKVSILWAI